MTVMSRLYCGIQHYCGLVSAARTRASTISNIWHTSTRGFRKSKSKPEGKVSLAPKVEFQTPKYNDMNRNLMKCTIFAAGFCTATFTGAIIWEYERMRQKSREPMAEWVKTRWNDMEGWQNKQGEFRQSLNKWWNGLSSGQKIFWPICFLNAIVYLSWQHPALKFTMLKYFAFSPAANAVCWPMLISTFSHFNFFHLAANMYVMHSFSTPLCDRLGQEQFLALYLSCGVISSLAGAAFKVLISSSSPSLGASGAIMGMLGYFCTVSPDSRLGIIFIPSFNFSAEYGLMALMMLDTLGLVCRWRVFDHAAHLSGALSGLAYAKWGENLWAKRNVVKEKWHIVRLQIDQTTKSR